MLGSPRRHWDGKSWTIQSTPVPAGAVAHRGRKIAFIYMAGYFVPVLAPVNQMSYDTVAFYNTAMAIVSGAGAAALSFCLIPPLSPAYRTRR